MRLINRIRQAQEEYERGEYVIWKPGMFAKSKPKKLVKEVRQHALKKIKRD